MKSYAIMDGLDVECFDRVLGMLDRSIDELRHLAYRLIPGSLTRYGLKVALEDFCYSIPGINFQYFGGDLRPDDWQEILIYRCTCELVNNAVKHAEATEINVQLIVDDGLVSLTVYDNGVGFDFATVAPDSRLGDIRARVFACNGKMTIHSAPGKGTEVSIEIENLE